MVALSATNATEIIALSSKLKSNESKEEVTMYLKDGIGKSGGRVLFLKQYIDCNERNSDLHLQLRVHIYSLGPCMM